MKFVEVKHSFVGLSQLCRWHVKSENYRPHDTSFMCYWILSCFLHQKENPKNWDIMSFCSHTLLQFGKIMQYSNSWHQGLLYRPSRYGIGNTYRSDLPPTCGSLESPSTCPGIPCVITVVQTDMYHTNKSLKWVRYTKWRTLVGIKWRITRYLLN